MIYLYQYPPIWELSSLSPFCIKVELYLRMANLPYEIIIENNPRKGLKGKMPMLKDGDDIIPDSFFIIKHLQNKYSAQFDHGLSIEQKALGHTIAKMIEESLYFTLLYSRWIDPVGKKIIDKEFRHFFPKFIGKFILGLIRYRLKKQAYYQGVGRHTLQEVYELGSQDIIALSKLMGNNYFMLDNEVREVDATVYAFLITILYTPFDNLLTKTLKEQENLVNYCHRMRDKYFL